MTVYNDRDGKPLRLHALVRLSQNRRPGAMYRVTRMFESAVDGTPWIETVGPEGPAGSTVVSRRTESVELIRYDDVEGTGT